MPCMMKLQDLFFTDSHTSSALLVWIWPGWMQHVPYFLFMWMQSLSLHSNKVMQKQSNFKDWKYVGGETATLVLLITRTVTGVFARRDACLRATASFPGSEKRAISPASIDTICKHVIGKSLASHPWGPVLLLHHAQFSWIFFSAV